MSKIHRYFEAYWEPNSSIVVCDHVWFDRKTGEVVIRYDAADPANTNPSYGAMTDAERFERKGLDRREMIDLSEAKVPMGKETEHMWHVLGRYY